MLLPGLLVGSCVVDWGAFLAFRPEVCHQARDPATPDLDAVAAQLAPDFPGAVNPTVLVVHALNFCHEFLVSTVQVGSTPNRSSYSVMNAASVAVEGRATSRRKPTPPSESHSPDATRQLLDAAASAQECSNFSIG